MQILINLINNGIKFTDKGQVALNIRVISKDTGTIKLRFDVSDTGIGMNSQQIHGLFEPFHQVDSSTTRKFGGTGLGLTISQSLVNQMGGRIEVSSQQGEGSKFQFTLVFKRAKAQDITSTQKIHSYMTLPSHALTETIDSPALHILVVEDNVLNQEVALGLLESMHMKPVIADSGYEAIKKIQQQSFDMVFMDIQMPGMDGYETTDKIRKIPGKEHIPIIAMTAHATSNDIERCLSNGMNDYISKPVNIAHLFEIIKKYKKLSDDYQIKIQTISDNLNSIEKTDTTLPLLYGIDMESGLRRMQNKKNMYLSLLKKFHSQHQYDMDHIRAAIEKQDMKSAEIQCHTLQGVSGNLSAYLLHDYCKKLMVLLKDKSPEIINSNTFNELITVFTQTMESLKSINQTKLDMEASQHSDNFTDDTPLHEIIKSLEKSIKTGNINAIRYTTMLKKYTSNDECSSLLNALSQCLEDYDFNQAEKLLPTLIDKLR